MKYRPLHGAGGSRRTWFKASESISPGKKRKPRLAIRRGLRRAEEEPRGTVREHVPSDGASGSRAGILTSTMLPGCTARFIITYRHVRDMEQ